MHLNVRGIQWPYWSAEWPSAGSSCLSQIPSTQAGCKSFRKAERLLRTAAHRSSRLFIYLLGGQLPSSFSSSCLNVLDSNGSLLHLFFLYVLLYFYLVLCFVPLFLSFSLTREEFFRSMFRGLNFNLVEYWSLFVLVNTYNTTFKSLISLVFKLRIPSTFSPVCRFHIPCPSDGQSRRTAKPEPVVECFNGCLSAGVLWALTSQNTFEYQATHLIK